MSVTVDAIRKRISRGTIPHERDEDGRVWVLLDADQDSTSKVQDTDQLRSDKEALISEMRDRIASLERQLEQERQANSEYRRLLAAALERIPPQLEAPQEARESPQTGEEQQGRPQSPTPMLQARQMPYIGRGRAGCSGEGDKHGPKNEDHGADRGRVGQEPPTRRRRHHRERHYIH